MPDALYQTLDTLSASTRYNAWIHAVIKKHLSGKILDIGSGLGDITQLFLDNPAVTEVTASDYTAPMISALQNKFSAMPRMKVARLDITDRSSLGKIPTGGFDTVTCLNIIEHISDDVEALRHIHSLLNPRGRLVVLTPAFPGLYGSLDALVGHYRRYTKKSLSAAAAKAGFKVAAIFYMNMFGTITWFIAGKILKQKQFNKNACRCLDQAVPLLQTLEKGAPPPFGQSVVMVCAKSKS
ncbi:MAG: class I SAM-dependent methyltransferase [Candidatus Omnitrophica bacterium]|nr:class I SAM-dependent methyltransferase [Candidatus Omnitrophota bacterium]